MPKNPLTFAAPAPHELYLPEGKPPFALICITPLLGRFLLAPDLFLERYFARFFASRGVAAAVIDRPIFEHDPSRGLEQIQEYLDGSIERNKRVLDELLRTKTQIDPRRVGSFGISFGAVLNSLWVASDSRLRVNFFSLAGGNLAEIIVTSRDPLMKSYVRSMLGSNVGATRRVVPTLEDLKADLKKAIRFDPLDAASLIPKKENILMHFALFDRVVRLRYGLQLWRALGKPKVLFLPFGHYSAVLTVPFVKWSVLNFFKERL